MCYAAEGVGVCPICIIREEPRLAVRYWIVAVYDATSLEADIPRWPRGYRSQTQIIDGLPVLAAAYAHRIPNRGVIAKVVCEVEAAAGLMEDGDFEVGVQVR